MGHINLTKPRHISLFRLFFFHSLYCKPFLLLSFFFFPSMSFMLPLSLLLLFISFFFFSFFLFLSCKLHTVFFFFYFFFFFFSFFFFLTLACSLLSFFLSLTLSSADSLFSFQIWCVGLFYGLCKLKFCELFWFFFLLQICVLVVFRSEGKRCGKRRGSQFWLIWFCDMGLTWFHGCIWFNFFLYFPIRKGVWIWFCGWLVLVFEQSYCWDFFGIYFYFYFVLFVGL